MTTRACGSSGFSLVEVLVSMLVVTIGILALAALLQSSTRYARLSEQRSAATLLANDIADRVRANPVGAALGPNGGYDLSAHGFPSPLPPAATPCTAANPCSQSDLAKADLAAWTARLRATLPKGSALLRYRAGVAPATDAVDVWLGWADPNAPAAATGGPGSGTECPPEWSGTDATMRCLYLDVAL